LLHVLLRHSVQLEYTAAAARLASSQAGAPPLATLLRDVELVNFNAGTAVTTWRALLTRPNAATGNVAPATFLKTLTQFDTPPLKALGELRAALTHLQGIVPETLQRLTIGTLDLASHRIDAWITSLASRRLNALRAQNPGGLRVGGYGWVINLKPEARQTPVATPVGETGPVFARADDSGFIHAPSVTQAQTAALLRNAHLTHAREDAQDLFAVDLSSRRVRLAKTLFDGVRQGQPLGALLGYLFERKMHELGLDADIDEFRKLAPLVPVNAPMQTQPAETIAARNVVDGLVLRDVVKNLFDFPPPDLLARIIRCEKALAVLHDAIDAVSDAAIAECAHQAVRGNIARTGATLQAIASGEAPPPELEGVRTPRTGIAVAHRVVALFNAIEARSAPASPRARAEPHLDAWAAKLLGPSGNVRFAVERLDANAGVTATMEMRLSDLALAPIDVVYLAPARCGEPMPEIDARALAVAAGRFGALGAGESLRVNRARSTDWLPAEIGLDELTELAARARVLFAGLRALDARDLASLQQTVEPATDADDLDRRAREAQQALATALAGMQSALAASSSDTTALRDAISAMSRFGIPGSAPQPFADGDTLVVQGAALAREAARRVERAQTAANAGDLMRAVFGDAFLALPRFTITNSAELSQSLAATEALQGGSALAVYPWFHQAQRVREPLSRLGASLHAAEAVGAGARLELAVAQLPHVASDRWVGLPADAEHPVAAGRISIIVHADETLDLSKPLAGVLIDEWVEVVPSSSETTAIAFQHDAPDSRAPQAMLLAVPAVPGDPWTGAALHRLLLDTLSLAQVRAVDAEALDTAVMNPVAGAQSVGELAHFLPALHFAVNVDGDAPSPDFRKLMT
jgi:hypothetical protein